MATTQQIVGALRKAGKVAYLNVKGKPIRYGYRVARWNRGTVGVLAGTHETREELMQIIEAAGFRTYIVSGMAPDGFFVDSK